VTGLAVLAVAVLLAAVLAAAHRWYDGRFRNRLAQPPTSPDLRESLPGRAGDRATLVQFSSAFCAPCRATRSILADVASAVPGVVHVEIDAEAHLDLVRRLDILKTPTTLVLDDRGVEVSRAVGQPKKTAVLAALGQAVRS
jgi:thiol-disulfide isomerase/thioredoxin